MEKQVEELLSITIRFAGDSGDGMQLTGTQFSDTSAFVGNDLSTLPNFPAEIRAPAGTLYGVSGFQLHFGSEDINTPGDQPDVLVAMNPAALKVNLKDMVKGTTIIVNSDAFDTKGLQLAEYKSNPLEDGSLSDYHVYQIPLTTLTINSLEGLGLSMKEMTRCKNFFALGLMYWLFDRPLEPTLEWIQAKFKNNPTLAKANEKALREGYYFGETAEFFTTRYSVKPAELPAGTYRSLMGNEGIALGFVAASYKSGLPLFQGSYPITPASEILHELSRYKNFGVITFQAEDEIAGICTAIGASYGGSLAVTTTSGPGLALKTEAIGLATMLELPLVVVDVQRGGPSTGLPTKMEQADLLQSMFGRNGECPVPIIAANSPVDCFYTAYEAARIALKFMTPVILLSDGYLAFGAEPFKIPNIDDLPEIKVEFWKDKETFKPYARNEFLARPWAIPGTPGLEHRIGGLEKKHIDGTISYDPENHDFMVKLRDQKVKNIADDIPLAEVDGPEKGKLLVVGWGSTYGVIKDAIKRLRFNGYEVSYLHLRYLNPFPKNLGEILNNFENIFLPEINLGQLAFLLKAKFLKPIIQYNKVRGLPFKSTEIESEILKILGGTK